MHFCQLDLTVHASLINLKFRTRAYRRSLSVPAFATGGNGGGGGGGGGFGAVALGLIDSTPAATPAPAAARARSRFDFSRPSAGTSTRRVSGSGRSGSQVAASLAELLFPWDDSDEPVPAAAAVARHRTVLAPLLRSLDATAAALRSLCDMMGIQASAVGTMSGDGANGAANDGGSGGLWGTTDGSARARAASASAATAGGVSLAAAGAVTLLNKPFLSDSDAAAGDVGAALARVLDGPAAELTPARVAAAVEADAKRAAQRCFLLWGRLVALLPQHDGGGHMRIAARLRSTWLTAERRWWEQWVCPEQVRVQKIMQPHDLDKHEQLATATRGAISTKAGGPAALLTIYDQELLRAIEQLPVCIRTSYGRSLLGNDRGVPGSGAAADSAGGSGIAAATAALNALELEGDGEERKGPHLIVMQHGW